MKNEVFLTFKEHIDKIIPISEQIWDELLNILSFRELKKDDFIVKEDQKYSKEIFLHQGVIRGFYRSNAGNELNVAFYQDNEIICPWFSRTRGSKSIINLQTITPAIIIEMDQDEFKVLRHKYKELLFYGSKVVENELDIKTQREIFLLIKSAEERYLIFRKIYPKLENKIPQLQIASFLGITPVSLSRLRKNMIKK